MLWSGVEHKENSKCNWTEKWKSVSTFKFPGNLKDLVPLAVAVCHLLCPLNSAVLGTQMPQAGVNTPLGQRSWEGSTKASKRAASMVTILNIPGHYGPLRFSQQPLFRPPDCFAWTQSGNEADWRCWNQWHEKNFFSQKAKSRKCASRLKDFIMDPALSHPSTPLLFWSISAAP